MQIDGIKGYRLTDIESEMYIIYELDRAFQKAVDALNKNEIGCASFTLSEEDIKQMVENVENGSYIKYDSLCN
jgi:hypothetical protein